MSHTGQTQEVGSEEDRELPTVGAFMGSQWVLTDSNGRLFLYSWSEQMRNCLDLQSEKKTESKELNGSNLGERMLVPLTKTRKSAGLRRRR